MTKRMTTAEKRNKVVEEYVLSLYQEEPLPATITEIKEIEWWFIDFMFKNSCEFSDYLKTKNKTTQQLFNRKKFYELEYSSYAEEYFDKWEKSFNTIQDLMDFVGYSDFSLK